MRGHDVPPLALRELDNGQLIMLVYTSPEAFEEGCGPDQPYIIVRAEAVQAFQYAAGADVVMWDAVLDPASWQDGEYHLVEERS